MTTFTWTFAPILTVLKEGVDGRISFQDLTEKLKKLDPERFRDPTIVDRAINAYIRCLDYDGTTVSFNREAKRYAKHSMMERDVQAILHKAVPDMENWQLYPFKTRENSLTCYISAPWKYVPKDPDEDRIGGSYPRHCDFRCDDEDSCRAGCGMSEDMLTPK